MSYVGDDPCRNRLNRPEAQDLPTKATSRPSTCLHLLAEAFAPGIKDRVVCCVSVQQRDFGEPLDDVIVDFRSATGEPARLSLQVKRSLTISDAKSNTDFREVVRDSWSQPVDTIRWLTGGG